MLFSLSDLFVLDELQNVLVVSLSNVHMALHFKEELRLSPREINDAFIFQKNAQFQHPVGLLGRAKADALSASRQLTERDFYRYDIATNAIKIDQDKISLRRIVTKDQQVLLDDTSRIVVGGDTIQKFIVTDSTKK